MSSPNKFSASPSSTYQSPPSRASKDYNSHTGSPNQLALAEHHQSRRNYTTNQTSVNLCCSNGDGTIIFCLGSRAASYFIERRTLPLHDETAAEPERQIRLPQRIQTALSLSPPVELLYVEGDSEYSNAAHLLCLYTQKQAFYVEVPHQQKEQAAEATVDVTTAFERYFMNADYEVNIVRIRAAPQRRKDYATLCPRGAMAMLTHNPNYNKYSLVLQHQHNQSLVTVPLMFSLEDLSGREQSITDFCFARSEGLALLSSLTVLLLKGSGEVLSASPILFDGCVVARTKLQESLEFLDYQIQTLNAHATSSGDIAKCNQCKVAKAVLRSAFGSAEDTGSKSHFRTAKVLVEATMDSPVTWAVQIQGPFLAMPRDHHSEGAPTHAVVIEPVTASELIGFAVGGEGNTIDLGMVPPSCLLPRFTKESDEDGYELDDALGAAGVIAQRVLLSDDGPSSSSGLSSNRSIALVPDSIMDSMIHYVTPSAVMTINTNAVRHVLHKVQGGNTAKLDSVPKTSAWSSITASSSTIEGVIVGSDTRFGHALIARLSDGTCTKVNCLSLYSCDFCMLRSYLKNLVCNRYPGSSQCHRVTIFEGNGGSYSWRKRSKISEAA